jgi:hypothetical protein
MFVSSWSTTPAADFDDFLPQERRNHPRPLPQTLPQAPTMFAVTMPQVPTTSAARNDATANDRANDGLLNFHRRSSANAQLGVGDSSHAIWTE